MGNRDLTVLDTMETTLQEMTGESAQFYFRA